MVYGLSKSEIQQNYFKIVQRVLAAYNVDLSRVYGVSLAGGSQAMWNTTLANPGVFAAEINTSDEPYDVWGQAQLAENNFGKIVQALPSWHFVEFNDRTSVGVLGKADLRLKGDRFMDAAKVLNKRGLNIDIAYGTDGELMWNGLLRGKKAEQLASAQLARARAHNSSHMLTIFMPNTILINPHWAWDAAYSNAVVRDWLFEQVQGSKLTSQ